MPFSLNKFKRVVKLQAFFLARRPSAEEYGPSQLLSRPSISPRY